MSYNYFDTNDFEYATLPVSVQKVKQSEQTLTGTMHILEHNHESVEMIYVTEGTLEIKIEKRVYQLKKGDVALCNPFEMHSIRFVEGVTESEFVCLSFSLRLLLFFYRSVLHKVRSTMLDKTYCLDPVYRQDRVVVDVIKSIQMAYPERTHASECLVLSRIYELFGYLLENHYHKNDQSGARKYDMEFVKAVSEYISWHCSEEIKMSDVLAELHMTESQFCHKFKRNFGTSFTVHLRKLRIIKAIQMYDGNLSMSEIAYRVGFSDYCYFSHSFKKVVGVSPTKYFSNQDKDNV